MVEKSDLYMQQLLASIDGGHWAINFAVVLALTIVVQLLWRTFSKKAEVLLKRSVNQWDDIIWYAALRPVNWLILLIGGSMAIRVIADSEDLLLSDYLPMIQKVAILLLIGWAFWRLVTRAEQVFTSMEGKDVTTIAAISKIAKLSVLVLVIISALQTIGVSIAGVLAFGGMGALGVGMAAKDLLSNLFGALMIYMDKPFRVGDWIRSPDKSIEGTVEEIGWRLTRIRTFDKRPLYVPNSIFTSVSVENPSRMSNRRIKETFTLRYDDIGKMKTIVDAVRDMIANHKDIDHNQTLIVNFDSYSDWSVDFFIYTFTKTTNWVEYHGIKQDVMLKINDIVEQHQAEFAFPTRQLYVDSVSESTSVESTPPEFR